MLLSVKSLLNFRDGKVLAEFLQVPSEVRHLHEVINWLTV
jgi:hypothetical protein